MEIEAETNTANRTWLIIGWLIVIAVAIGLRIWMWSFQARSGAVPPGDAEEYYRAALHMMQGSYDDTGKWLRPPLYPAFLAFWFSLLGVDLSRTLLAQAILSGLAVPAFGWLAQRLFGRSTVSLLAGLIAALFVPLASFGSVLFAEELFVVLMVLALVALDLAIVQGTFRTALLAGFVFGLAALTRAVAVSFIPIAAILVGAVGVGAYSYTRLRLQLRFRLAAALILGAALVIGPWALRNAIVHQRLILSDTNGGISMWYGVVSSDAEQRAGEAQLWAIPNPADRQALALRWTVAKIVQNPLWFVGRMRFKVASLYLLQIRSFAVGDSITIDPRDQLVAMGAGENPLVWSAIADGQYILIMLAAIAGICFAPNRRTLLPVLLWVLFVTFMSAITIGHPRLRLPIVALLIPCAAYGLNLGWRRELQNQEPRTENHGTNLVRAQRAVPQRNHGTENQESTSYGHSALCPNGTTEPGDHAAHSGNPIRNSRNQLIGRMALMLVGWLIYAALIFSTRYITWVRTWPDLQVAHAAMARSEYNTAHTSFERARSADPTNALRVIDLADLVFQRGDHSAALALYGQALKLEDRNLYAHAMRAHTAALLGRSDIAAAEQVALAGYGRDTNELYDWAWRAFENPLALRVVPGDPLALGQFVGFAPATPDLPVGRWTLGDARIRFAAGCGQVVVQIRGPVGRLATVAIEGHDVQQSVTLNGTVQEVRLAVVCSGEQASVKRVSTTIRIQSPTALLDIERAPWYGGIAVLEARIEGP
jgi:4-amino-4-deoxy-L-arabinose transferase-like glycosyltransferase